MTVNRSELGRFQGRFCSRTLAAVLLVAVVLVFFHQKAIAKGLLLGTCFSIINFLLLGMSIPFRLGRSRLQAGWIGLGSILTRYAFLAFPMVVATRSPSFDFVSVVIGIFAVQIMMMLDYTVIRPLLERKSSLNP